MQTEATRLPVTRRSPGTGATGHHVSSGDLGTGWCDPAQPGRCRAVLGARARLEHTLGGPRPCCPQPDAQAGAPPRSLRGAGPGDLPSSLSPRWGGEGAQEGRNPPEAPPARAVAWSKCPGACDEKERGASRGRRAPVIVLPASARSQEHQLAVGKESA